MSLTDTLAIQLRQAIQGCSVHSHGPIQAWAAIEQARIEGGAEPQVVARLAVAACTSRIHELLENGVDPTDLRVKKEELTRAFIEKLLL